MVMQCKTEEQRVCIGRDSWATLSPSTRSHRILSSEPDHCVQDGITEGKYYPWLLPPGLHVTLPQSSMLEFVSDVNIS